MLQPWLEDGFVSTPAQHLGSPSPGASLNQIQTAVNKGYQHIEYSERKLRATEYHRFLSIMKVDDFVVTAFEDALYLGIVTGEAHYADDASSRLRRSVAWQKTPINNEDVPAPLPRLSNTEGEPLRLITVAYRVADPAAVAAALGGKLRGEGDGRFVEMVVRLFASCTSGDSSFAMCRTSSKPRPRDAPAPTVPVTPPSKPYGTSTPGVFRPSARRKSTRYLLIVTSLFDDGDVSRPPAMFLRLSLSDTLPVSLKIVGHGEVAEQGAGDVT